jgi:hypothetical protein
MPTTTKKLIATEVKRQVGKASRGAMRMGKAAYDTVSMPDRAIDKQRKADDAKAKAKAKANRGKAPMDYMKPRNATEQKLVDDYNAKIESIRKKSPSK